MDEQLYLGLTHYLETLHILTDLIINGKTGFEQTQLNTSLKITSCIAEIEKKM